MDGSTSQLWNTGKDDTDPDTYQDNPTGKQLSIPNTNRQGQTLQICSFLTVTFASFVTSLLGTASPKNNLSCRAPSRSMAICRRHRLFDKAATSQTYFNSYAACYFLFLQAKLKSIVKLKVWAGTYTFTNIQAVSYLKLFS